MPPGINQVVVFGNDQKGLTPTQLSRIIFANPAGFEPANYPAQILDTGEVVPAPRPLLEISGNNSAQQQLVLSWEGPYVLPVSTNVLGPYLDITNAASARTRTTLHPQARAHFFRLRN